MASQSRPDFSENFEKVRDFMAAHDRQADSNISRESIFNSGKFKKDAKTKEHKLHSTIENIGAL